MIKTLIQTWLAPYEPYLWAGLAVVLVIGFGVFVHHERVIGEQKIIAADAKAEAKWKDKLAKIQATLQAKADKAEKDRDATQKTLDDYMFAHPVGSVWVCGPPVNSGRGLPKVTRPDPGHADSQPGPSPGGEVPGGSQVAATDIGPELDTIVRSFGTMAGLYQEYQRQPTVNVDAQHQR